MRRGMLQLGTVLHDRNACARRLTYPQHSNDGAGTITLPRSLRVPGADEAPIWV